MRAPFAMLLVVSLIGGAYVWYPIFKNPCDIPITYRIGDIDERFDISVDQVRVAAYDAEKIWESAVGADVFTYDEKGDVPIHFVYDERQKNATEAQKLETVLVETEHVNESLRSEYEQLLAEYTELKEEYEQRASIYEEELDAYNEEVRKWNEKGGAPEKEFKKLEDRKTSLDREQQALNTFISKLNQFVRNMNTLSAQGNATIDEYNEIAEEYNDRFGGGDTFTQGDYHQGEIRVYQFNDQDQLTLVLAHEFGHALSLDHVEGDSSIMFDTMKAQTLEQGVSEEDSAEYMRQCAAKNIPYLPFI